MSMSKVTIWNMALSSMGSTATVSSPEERSREANLCRLWYDLVRDNVLKAAPWPSALTTSRLALLSERSAFETPWTNMDPAPGWLYAYSLPADLLAPRWLESRASFTLSWSAGHEDNILSTNLPNALLTYTFRQERVTKWDAGLQDTVVETLAAILAQALAGKTALARELRQNAMDRILLAQTEVANERHAQYKHAPTAAVVRGYDIPTDDIEYIYPYETLSVGKI